MWSITAYDWKPTSAERVEGHVVRQMGRGRVVLLHDGGHLDLHAGRAHTVDATDRLIRRYRDQGFSFVTIPELMEAARA